MGFADGDDITTGSGTTANEMDADEVKAGIKYVSGDLTFNLGIVDGSTDNAFGSTGGSADSMNKASASVSYAVASGVTAILGYSNSDSQNEGASDDKDGSAWYIGANMSF